MLEVIALGSSPNKLRCSSWSSAPRFQLHFAPISRSFGFKMRELWPFSCCTCLPALQLLTLHDGPALRTSSRSCASTSRASVAFLLCPASGSWCLPSLEAQLKTWRCSVVSYTAGLWPGGHHRIQQQQGRGLADVFGGRVQSCVEKAWWGSCVLPVHVC